jgi:hypothetical protein
VNADVGKIIVKGKNVTVNVKDGVTVKKIVSKAEGTIVNGTSLPVGSNVQINVVTDASGEPTEQDGDDSVTDSEGQSGNDVSDTVQPGTDTADVPDSSDTKIPETDLPNADEPGADTEKPDTNEPSSTNKPNTSTGCTNFTFFLSIFFICEHKLLL